MPSRPTFPGVSAPPRLAYDSRRRALGVMPGRNGWALNGRPPARTAAPIPGQPVAPAEPGFRAPWGELERQIPFVTITTRPFPAEWWTPPSLRATAVTRATALPVEVITATATPARILIDAADDAPFLAIPIVSADMDQVAAPAGAHLAAQRTPNLAAPAPTPARASHEPRRSPAGRRSLAARLALLAVGLLISLIAVETASRRRG